MGNMQRCLKNRQLIIKQDKIKVDKKTWQEIDRIVAAPKSGFKRKRKARQVDTDGFLS